eukprot:6491112-Amphidinium_carterae.1
MTTESAQLDTTGVENSELANASGYLFALLKIDVKRFSQMAPLTDQMRLQVRFWQNVVGHELLDGQMIVINVHAMHPLVEVTPLRQLTQKKFRGVFIQLEEGQAEVLRGRLSSAGHAFCPASVPEVALRAPLAFVKSCVGGKHACFMMPHLPAQANRGTASLSVDFRLLGLAAQHVPFQSPVIANPLPDDAQLDQPAAVHEKGIT